MGFKTGDIVQLKEKFAGRRYKGKVQKILSASSGRVLVVAQPNNLTANFPENLWEKIEEGEET